ncbi:MAG: DUF1656 domain-containing protein [Micavibrio sp.]|nr:DUF1656 domain-containing protein [Micavibrio sp.]
MMHEVDLYGVLISPLLVCFVAAWVTSQFVTRALERVSFYRFVASRQLFDLATLITLTGFFALVFFGLENRL